MSAVVILFLIFDATIKLIPIQPVIDSMVQLGYPGTPGLARLLGVITLSRRFTPGRARRCSAPS